MTQTFGTIAAESIQVEWTNQRGPVMDEIIAIRYHKIRALANQVIDRLNEETAKLGFAENELELKKPIEANYWLERDQSSSEYSLIGDWQDEQGAKLGQLLFHADGSFLVEQDVIRPHPTRQGWLVKAVKAWGDGERIDTEVQLYPMSEQQSDNAA
ncbi:MAG: hypothetical protein ABW080_14255 [Candidatus Thiodiazotropha sp.]